MYAYIYLKKINLTSSNILFNKNLLVDAKNLTFILDSKKMNEKTYGTNNLTADQMFGRKKEAKEAGHTHYFTGKPCKYGHISPRYVSSGQCVFCQQMVYQKDDDEELGPEEIKIKEERIKKRKEYRQQYWLDNKERLSRLHTEWYRNNRKKENERDRKRYRKNRKKVIDRVKAYYHENRDEILEKKRQFRANNKGKIKEQNRKYYLKKKKERQEALEKENKGE